MRQLGLASFVPVTALQAVGLECFEITDTAHFQPALLRRAPKFHVVGKGTGEAHVATTKFKRAEVQFKVCKQRSHMLAHLFEDLVALIGMNDLYDLHFIELVKPVETAHILAITAGLTPETGR